MGTIFFFFFQGNNFKERPETLVSVSFEAGNKIETWKNVAQCRVIFDHQ